MGWRGAGVCDCLLKYFLLFCDIQLGVQSVTQADQKNNYMDWSSYMPDIATPANPWAVIILPPV